jgi:hypothetical protein
MQYAHVIVLAQKDKPIQLFGHPRPDSHPAVVPMSRWHVAAND